MRGIQRGIRKQMSVSPGTTPFVSLAESAIARKGLGKVRDRTRRLLRLGFSSTPTQKITADKAFVRFLRGTVNKSACRLPNEGLAEKGETPVERHPAKRRGHECRRPGFFVEQNSIAEKSARC